MVFYVPGTEETDSKKQNISLQQLGGGLTTAVANVATNAANTATNTSDIAAMKAAWASYTPTVSATSGSLTTTSTTGRYLQTGKTVDFTASVTLTNIGTATGRINLGLPATAGAGAYVVAGIERQVTGNAITGLISSGGTTALIDGYSGLTPNMIVNGYVLLITGVYESA